jgi:hypothetical protein
MRAGVRTQHLPAMLLGEYFEAAAVVTHFAAQLWRLTACDMSIFAFLDLPHDVGRDRSQGRGISSAERAEAGVGGVVS